MADNQNKIKILYITAALEVGGAENFLYDLVKHLDQQRFSPAVATVVGGGSLEKKFQELGVPVYIFGRHRLRYLSGFWQFLQLYFLCRRLRPTLVHTQLFPADLWGRLAARLAKVPVIITTEQNINVDQSWLREELKTLTYRLATSVAAISTAVKNYIIKRYNVPEDKITVIPNDVDVKKFKVQSSKFKTNKKKIILNVGRMVEQKGQRYLLEAFSLLPPKEDFELWLAGYGVLKSKLVQQAKDLKIINQVKFLDPPHNVPELLAQVDLFVFPSLWEGLGIAVLEAAAAGVPIVATAVDGVLDILNEKSAWLVKPGDSQALARAISKAFSHTALTQQMVQTAYQFVKDNFDIKVVVKKYEDLYNKFL